MIRLKNGAEWPWPPPVLLTADGPQESAISRHRFDQLKRNSDWLQAHQDELLPQALGKFVGVAGEEAFLADSPEEAWAKVRAAHPEDEGAFVEYFRPEKGPRIYANCR